VVKATPRLFGGCFGMRTELLLLPLIMLTGCGVRQEPPSNNSAESGTAETASHTSQNLSQSSAAPKTEPKPPAPAAQPDAAPAAVKAANGGACFTDDGKAVPSIALRAVGTEPFWGAKIEGRCVTYSHPEDQAGTRIWTHFSGTGSAGEWRGAYEGKPFVLRTSRMAGCSDGMSDRRYPLAVTLSVAGEDRRGCAEPR
jgi:uncharacterized membrane protein